jgi:hypothetical protein
MGGEVDEIYLEESNDGGVTWNTVATMDNAQSVACSTRRASS